MKFVINGRLLLLAFIVTFIGGFICYKYSQSEIPDKTRINELVNYADGIAYLRIGTNVTGMTDKVDGVKVTTEMDERNKETSEVDFIVKIQDSDYKGTIRVVYPINRSEEGRLLIGVNYRKVEAYYFTTSIYIMILIALLITSYFILNKIEKLRVKKHVHKF